jgi:hypothetical protein
MPNYTHISPGIMSYVILIVNLSVSDFIEVCYKSKIYIHHEMIMEKVCKLCFLYHRTTPLSVLTPVGFCKL